MTREEMLLAAGAARRWPKGTPSTYWVTWFGDDRANGDSDAVVDQLLGNLARADQGG